jgi:hypothetical protein
MLMIRGHNGRSDANRNSFFNDDLESIQMSILCEMPHVKDSAE